MTVATTNSTQTFAGGQSVLTFTFRNLVSNPNYIQVNVLALTGGSITPLVYNVGYTVTLNSSGVGGTVTVSPSYGSNYNYIVYRQTSILQPSAYTDYNSFPASTLENNLDQLTMIEQEAETNQLLTLSLPIGTTGISATIPTPTSVSTGTLLLAWNQAGTALVNVYSSSASTLVSSTVSQAQAGTDNTTFMTPTMTTVAIKQFSPISTVSSSTSDVTVSPTAGNVVISSINAATSGSNTIIRTGTDGFLHVSYPFIKVSEQVSSGGGNGGSAATTTWTNYPLNLKETDTANIATLSSNLITIPSGTYLIDGVVTAQGIGGFQSRLYATTIGSVAIIGISTVSNTGVIATAFSRISGYLTITGSTSFGLQYYSTEGGGSLGTDCNSGINNVYAYATFLKIN